MSVTYAQANRQQSQTRLAGAFPATPQGGDQPASKTQFNLQNRNLLPDGSGAARTFKPAGDFAVSKKNFSLQGQRQLAPCPNGRGQACGGKRLKANAGGPNLPMAVNSTFLGSQTNMDALGFRPDYNAAVVEAQFTRNSAYQLVSAESLDPSVDGSTWFCNFQCPGMEVSGAGLAQTGPVNCGWCQPAAIASRDPARTLLSEGGGNGRNHRDDIHANHKSHTAVRG